MVTRSRKTEQERRDERSTWPVARFRLGDEPDDLSEVTTAAQRIAMMRVLSETAWTLAGRPYPTYGRADIPARLFRSGRPPDDGEP